MMKNIIIFNYDIFTKYFDLISMSDDKVINVLILLAKLLLNLYKK